MTVCLLSGSWVVCVAYVAAAVQELLSMHHRHVGIAIILLNGANFAVCDFEAYYVLVPSA
jgi:hypothetical protein